MIEVGRDHAHAPLGSGGHQRVQERDRVRAAGQGAHHGLAGEGRVFESPARGEQDAVASHGRRTPPA